MESNNGISTKAQSRIVIMEQNNEENSANEIEQQLISFSSYGKSNEEAHNSKK